jgi:hypothetical protein
MSAPWRALAATWDYTPSIQFICQASQTTYADVAKR